MKLFLGLLLLLFSFGDIGDIRDIAKINNLKKQAQEAYRQKDYAAAAESYKRLVEDFKVDDDHVNINLANAYYVLKDTANASRNYEKAVSALNKNIKSQALSQLGVIAHDGQKLQNSLALFKEALKADPTNETARYNFELVKKILDNQKDEEDQKDGEDDKIKPSDFAKKLKEQADRLVLSRKYGEAFDLMINGLKQDQTVSYYKDFIGRINDIIEIEK